MLCSYYILKSRCFTLDAFVRNSLTDLLACVEDILSSPNPLSAEDVKRVQEAMRADAESGAAPKRGDDTYNALRSGSSESVRESRGSQAMAEDAIVDVLRPATNWTSESLRRFARDVEVLSFSDHHVIISAGAAADAFYIVVDGAVELSRPIPPGQSTTTCTVPLSRGFGWETLEGTRTYEYTATALRSTRVLRVPVELHKPMRQSKRGSLALPPKETTRHTELLRGLSHGEQTVQLLQSTSIFSGLTRSELRFLALLAEPERFSPGETISKHGVNDGTMQVLVSGSAQTRLPTWDSTLLGKTVMRMSEHELPPIMRGGIINCRAAVDVHWKSIVAVEATSECYTVALKKLHLEVFLRQYPSRFPELEASSRAVAHEMIRQSHVPLFWGREHLGHSGQFWEETFPPGADIFEVGDVGDYFYIVMNGTAEILGRSGAIIETLGPGEYFGEMAFIKSSGRRLLGARAGSGEPLSVKVTGRSGFSRLFASEPAALAEIEIRVLATQVPVESLLNHPEALQAFSEHMMNEYAYENVEFYMKSRKFTVAFVALDAKYGVDTNEKIFEDDTMLKLAAAGVLEIVHSGLDDILDTIRTIQDVAISSKGAGSSRAQGEEDQSISNVMEEPIDSELSDTVTRSSISKLCGQKAWSIINPDGTLSFEETVRILLRYMKRHLACCVHGDFIVEDSPKQVKA